MDAKNALDAAYPDDAYNPETGWRQRNGKSAMPDKDGKTLLQQDAERARDAHGHIYVTLMSE